MYNSEETCGNIKALRAAKIKSLCLTCKNSPACSDAFASDLIGEAETQSDKKHITKVCFDYEKVRTFDRAGEETNPEHDEFGNLSPRLHEAKVEDRCVTCPPFTKSNCQRRQRLDKLTDISQKAGRWVEFQVVHCDRELVSIRLPNQPSEPERSL